VDKCQPLTRNIRLEPEDVCPRDEHDLISRDEGLYIGTDGDDNYLGIGVDFIFGKGDDFVLGSDEGKEDSVEGRDDVCGVHGFEIEMK
jgi:tetrahydromethanopterin S-methyltransferase subunit F